jgi:hypothetical protein
MASKELSGNGTEHDEHEEEQHHDIKHDRQWIQNGGYQTGHVWDLIDSS